MTRDEIYDKVRVELVDALGVDEEEVTPDARLVSDLGAESIDFLDITHKLEQAFDFRITEGEMFPSNVARDPTYVQDGKVTAVGIQELKAKLPHFDFSEFEKDPQVRRIADVFTVDAIVNFVQRKLDSNVAA